MIEDEFEGVLEKDITIEIGNGITYCDVIRIPFTAYVTGDRADGWSIQQIEVHATKAGLTAPGLVATLKITSGQLFEEIAYYVDGSNFFHDQWSSRCDDADEPYEDDMQLKYGTYDASSL